MPLAAWPPATMPRRQYFCSPGAVAVRVHVSTVCDRALPSHQSRRRPQSRFGGLVMVWSRRLQSRRGRRPWRASLDRRLSRSDNALAEHLSAHTSLPTQNDISDRSLY